MSKLASHFFMRLTLVLVLNSCNLFSQHAKNDTTKKTYKHFTLSTLSQHLAAPIFQYRDDSIYYKHLNQVQDFNGDGHVDVIRKYEKGFVFHFNR